MEKSIYSNDYAILIEKLRKAREKRGITQAQLAEKLNQTQSFISKVERSERRLDIVELRAFCRAIGISFSSFIGEIDKSLNGGRSK